MTCDNNGFILRGNFCKYKQTADKVILASFSVVDWKLIKKVGSWNLSRDSSNFLYYKSDRSQELGWERAKLPRQKSNLDLCRTLLDMGREKKWSTNTPKVSTANIILSLWYGDQLHQDLFWSGGFKNVRIVGTGPNESGKTSQIRRRVGRSNSTLFPKANQNSHHF